MKKKIVAVGLVVLLLVGGLILASCSACPGLAGKDKGSCNLDYKTLGDASKAKDCENLCISGQLLDNILNATGKKYKCDC